MFVSDRMSKNPIIISPDESVQVAMKFMKEKDVRRLPVVTDGKIVGYVTKNDFASVMPSAATTLAKYEINSLLSKVKVKDIMSKKVISVNETATIEEAALLMAQNKIGSLPVLSELGDVIGVITDTDIFRTFVDIMGLTEGKTRITISVDNKIGVVEEIAGIFAESGLNIDSLVTCKKGEGKYDIILRGNFGDVGDISAKLSSRGYEVTHCVRIN